MGTMSQHHSEGGKGMSEKMVPVEPTEEMLIAARDWSYAMYGKPVGNAAATGCYRAMLAAAPAPVADGLVERLLNIAQAKECRLAQLAAVMEAIAPLVELEKLATPGPWTVYDSNSWRRIGSERDYHEILWPCKQQDGHPDFCGHNRDADLALIVALRNAFPALSRAVANGG